MAESTLPVFENVPNCPINIDKLPLEQYEELEKLAVKHRPNPNCTLCFKGFVICMYCVCDHLGLLGWLLTKDFVIIAKKTFLRLQNIRTKCKISHQNNDTWKLCVNCHTLSLNVIVDDINLITKKGNCHAWIPMLWTLVHVESILLFIYCLWEVCKNSPISSIRIEVRS